MLKTKHTPHAAFGRHRFTLCQAATISKTTICNNTQWETTKRHFLLTLHIFSTPQHPLKVLAERPQRDHKKTLTSYITYFLLTFTASSEDASWEAKSDACAAARWASSRAARQAFSEREHLWLSSSMRCMASTCVRVCMFVVCVCE